MDANEGAPGSGAPSLVSPVWGCGVVINELVFPIPIGLLLYFWPPDGWSCVQTWLVHRWTDRSVRA